MGNNIDTGNYSRNNIVEVTSNNIKQYEYRAETYAQKAEKSLLECLSCTSLVQGILNACTEIKENLENLFFTDLDEHKEDNENPHNVTAAQVGTYTKETIDNLLSGKQPVGNYLTEHQDITGKQDVSTAVTHSESTAVGSATKGVYVGSDGSATAMTYSVNKDVPSDAQFTDTTYSITTGSTNGTIAVSENGGTATDVSVYGLGSAAYTNSSAYATSSQGTKADSAIQSVKVNGSALTPDANKAVDIAVPAAQVNSDWNASGGVAQILNKPAIPTVNNATLTIQKNSTTVQTFTANASSDVTCNITVPTDTGDLTNNAGFITSSALSGYQTTSNLVTSISSLSTDAQYPSAKCVYDIIGDIESLLSQV